MKDKTSNKEIEKKESSTNEKLEQSLETSVQDENGTEIISIDETPVEQLEEGVTEDKKEQQELQNLEEEKKLEEVKEENTEIAQKASAEVKEEDEKEEIEKNKEDIKQEKTETIYKKVPVKQKKNIKLGVFIVTIVVLAVIIMLISTVFALANIGNNKILDGITIKGISLVGLTREDAKLELEDALQNELQKNVLLQYQDYETSLAPQQIEASYDIDKAIDEAYRYGRDGNIIKNNFDILFAMLFGKEISIDFSYNDELLTQICEDVSKKLPGAMKDNSYYIEDTNLIITRGTAGIVANIPECKKAILKQVQNPMDSYITIPVQESEPGEIDINKIYNEVKKEPKDAYYTEDPFTIHPHENGIDFAITLEEASKLLEEEKSEYTIPLVYTEPDFTTDEIGVEAFPNELSYFSTRYDASLRNRSINLELSAGKINGTVLLPGEEFSYNQVVGERTIAAGYKEAAMYSGGKVVDGLGGGICQISSTLYNVVVQANLEVLERSNHQFKTSYVDVGKDATVVYGAIDFRFKNTRNYPIKIVTSVKNGVAEMWIYGVKEEPEYDIKIETERISTIPYSTKYIEDSSLEAGVEVVDQVGAPGYKSIAYKVCRLNGMIVSKTVLSNDTYSPMTRIVRRGTKNSNPVKSTAPANTTTD